MKTIESRLSEVLSSSCQKVELLASDDEMVLWLFDLDDDTSGMVTLEDNADLGIPPTVSIAIAVASAATLSREEMLKLFDLNGLLYHASITASEVGGQWTFYLQWRDALAHFKPEEFLEKINHLQSQRLLLSGE